MSETPLQPPAPRRPRWKDPFVLAFVVGVVVLTVLPVMQRQFLNAPPPVMVLDAWALTALPDGGALSSANLRGKVVLVMLAPSPCDQACVDRQVAFGLALKHTDDLGDAVHLLTVAAPGAEVALAPLAVPGSRWHLGGGDTRALLGTLREGWARWAGTDAGQSWEEFSRLPAVALVDQDGAVRGFWHDDSGGRGNAINGARLLARRGPTP
jgi:hypothetical protein